MLTHPKLAVLLAAILLPVAVLASTAEQIQMAADRGQVAFLLVTGPDATGVEQARQIVSEAKVIVPGSVVIEMDRADAANAALVKKYGLAAAPVPLVLVFSSGGIMSGGNVASKLTSRSLVAMVPSPKKAEVLKALQSGQAVYVTAFRTGMASRAGVTGGCAAACTQMMGKSVALDIDMDDPAETEFLKQLKIDIQSAEPVTVVFNAKGQLTASYTGMVNVEDLVASATKVAASGCCPSGSGKSCGPTPKKGS